MHMITASQLYGGVCEVNTGENRLVCDIRRGICMKIETKVHKSQVAKNLGLNAKPENSKIHKLPISTHKFFTFF